MPRPPAKHKRRQLRCQVRVDILDKFDEIIKKQNLFNPSKKAYSDMTKVIEPMLLHWLYRQMGDEEFHKYFAAERVE